ncbi:hypothetical protein BDV95DRAFT_593853 [Massariosphaeria phaeospora]|uniref:Uncharacterized protein n=1 Tax=Massariosphaeria phaeospora TaxID=100035 RepID=A0A7C8IEZ7_9PLEO|nr:hypothetical protein BDV95DRAFT_593853 [Massariosphaeria phaeospora]
MSSMALAKSWWRGDADMGQLSRNTPRELESGNWLHESTKGPETIFQPGQIARLPYLEEVPTDSCVRKGPRGNNPDMYSHPVVILGTWTELGIAYAEFKIGTSFGGQGVVAAHRRQSYRSQYRLVADSTMPLYDGVETLQLAAGSQSFDKATYFQVRSEIYKIEQSGTLRQVTTPGAPLASCLKRPGAHQLLFDNLWGTAGILPEAPRGLSTSLTIPGTVGIMPEAPRWLLLATSGD